MYETIAKDLIYTSDTLKNERSNGEFTSRVRVTNVRGSFEK